MHTKIMLGHKLIFLPHCDLTLGTDTTCQHGRPAEVGHGGHVTKPHPFPKILPPPDPLPTINNPPSLCVGQFLWYHLSVLQNLLNQHWSVGVLSSCDRLCHIPGNCLCFLISWENCRDFAHHTNLPHAPPMINIWDQKTKQFPSFCARSKSYSPVKFCWETQTWSGDKGS